MATPRRRNNRLHNVDPVSRVRRTLFEAKKNFSTFIYECSPQMSASQVYGKNGTRSVLINGLRICHFVLGRGLS
jgi:hypothetical protein